MKKQLGSEFAGAQLVGVTSTLYESTDDPRFSLALEGAEKYRDNGLPLVAVDGSPIARRVRSALKERSVLVVPSELDGIATQRKQGVAYAFEHGADKLVSHELEKVRMSEFSQAIARKLDEHAVLVIGRTAAAERTLPTVLRRTERLAGWILEKTHNLPADALSGGRGFTSQGAEVLTQYPAREEGFNNWIYLHWTPLKAREAGLSVGGLSVDLTYPPTMAAQEQGNTIFDRKRYDQFKLQLEYLLSRIDVDPVSRPIADAVLQAMAGLTSNSENADFEQQLNRLEDRLVAFGYCP